VKTSAFSRHETLKFYVTHANEKVSLDEAKKQYLIQFFLKEFCDGR